MKRVFVIGSIMVLIGAPLALSSGLSIPEQGAAAMGMSAAMTARSEDLSALYYNPAGLDYVEGFELMAGVTPIMPSHHYSPFYDDKRDFRFKAIEAESNTFLPPQLYAAFRVSSKMVLGVGVFSPFGLGTEWDDKWNGRYTSTFAEIQTIYINPTLSLKLSEKATFGVGVSYVTSSAAIEKMVDAGALISPNLMGNKEYDSKFKIDGDASAVTYNLGLIVRPAEQWQLGVSYRGAYDLDYEGKAKFLHADKTIPVPDGQGGVVMLPLSQVLGAQLPASQDGTATLNMPWMLNFGSKFDITPKWDFSADLNLVGWSVYEDLVLDFDTDLPADKQVLKKNWKNSFVVRGGTSYDYSDKLILRAGALLDKNPIPDDTFDGQLPDSNRYGLSVGAGYTLGKVRFDASYLLLNFFKREKDNGVGMSVDTTGDGTIDRFDIPGGYQVGNGIYESRAHLLSVSASVVF